MDAELYLLKPGVIIANQTRLQHNLYLIYFLNGKCFTLII